MATWSTPFLQDLKGAKKRGKKSCIFVFWPCGSRSLAGGTRLSRPLFQNVVNSENWTSDFVIKLPFFIFFFYCFWITSPSFIIRKWCRIQHDVTNSKSTIKATKKRSCNAKSLWCKAASAIFTFSRSTSILQGTYGIVFLHFLTLAFSVISYELNCSYSSFFYSYET